MNRLIFHNHDNVSIKHDNRGILPLIPILVGVLVAGGMALVAWAFFAELWISTMIFLVIFFFIWMMIKGMEHGIVGKRGMVLGILLIFILLISAVVISPIVFTLSLGPSDLNDYKTKEFSHVGWRGKGTFTDGTEGSELIDDHFYVSSWTDIEESQKIVIQGKLVLDDLGEGAAINAEYKVFLATGEAWGDPVYKFKNLNFPGGVVDEVLFESKIWTIDGNFEGWLKVELHVEFFGIGWREMAQDCAQVESGKGEVEFVKGIYEIGEMAELELELGFADGQYWLDVKALTSGEMLYEGFVDESREGRTTRMKFEVKASHVQIGTWPDCKPNLIEAKLWNRLFEKAQHETAVTDIKTLGPDKPTISLSDPKDDIAYRTGETITITIKAEPNIQTQAAIMEYRLRISPGDIIDDNNTDGKFTFKPPHRGTYKLMASCQDAVCRRSEVVTKEIHVYDKGEEVSFAPGDIPWILVVLLLVWGMVGAYIYYEKKVPGTTKNKLIIILSGFAIIALAYFMEWIPYG